MLKPCKVRTFFWIEFSLFFEQFLCQKWTRISAVKFISNFGSGVFILLSLIYCLRTCAAFDEGP